MRADRLVAILLLLQARGRMTAPRLAGELEVSVKTARRDLEALAAAGVPVYAQPGRNGGWSLLGGAKTDLSGLTAGEARALFLVAGPSAPLAPEARSALRKLVRALPETFRSDAERAASAIVLDPARWGESPPDDRNDAHLATLQHAVIDERRVRIAYTDRQRQATERTVDPLGLVRKAHAWYLVAGTEAGQRTFLLSRIRSVDVTTERSKRPADFDLAAAWRSGAEEVERVRSRPRVRAIVRVVDAALQPLGDHFGNRLELLAREPDGKAVVAITAPMAEMLAEQLAGWEAFVEVLAPDEVRGHLARIGRALVSLYAPDGAPVAPNAGPGVERRPASLRRPASVRPPDSAP